MSGRSDFVGGTARHGGGIHRDGHVADFRCHAGLSWRNHDVFLAQHPFVDALQADGFWDVRLVKVLSFETVSRK